MKITKNYAHDRILRGELRTKINSGITHLFRNNPFVPEWGNHSGTCQLFPKTILFRNISNINEWTDRRHISPASTYFFTTVAGPKNPGLPGFFHQIKLP
jgi:hypothetical protein